MIDVTLLGDGACGIVHRDSGAEVRSSVPPDYGGAGGTFSSTDLLAAALGSCIGSNLEPVALRHDIPLDAIRIAVEKTLGTSPRRIESLAVTVRIGRSVAPGVMSRLARAAGHCLVHRSLSAEVAVTIDVKDAEAP